ncbi:hypothetical protein ACCI51_01665 [Microbulbifer echini]|uniref:Secreted protein n=1 Tax=Microbulbifer echini TaxID=1529067 RepID=A0ABV4NIK5_9GAMM
MECSLCSRPDRLRPLQTAHTLPSELLLTHVMRNGSFRTLLLILLLAFAGLASAVPCAEPADIAPQSMTNGEQSHCASDQPADCRSEHSGDCGIECSCCPGLSNSLAAVSESKPNFTRSPPEATAYSVFTPAPDPENTLRPPILR